MVEKTLAHVLRPDSKLRTKDQSIQVFLKCHFPGYHGSDDIRMGAGCEAGLCREGHVEETSANRGKESLKFS